MAHKDLSDWARAELIEPEVRQIVRLLHRHGQSLGLGREAMLKTYDSAAEELAAENGEMN